MQVGQSNITISPYLVDAFISPVQYLSTNRFISSIALQSSLNLANHLRECSLDNIQLSCVLIGGPCD